MDCYHVFLGIKKSSAGEYDTEIFLQVSLMLKDIHISSLSDDDFSEVGFNC